MTDLILVDPPVASDVRLGKLAKAGSFWPSLGLAFLAAVARNQGFSVKIIDSNARGLSKQSLIKEFEKEDPRFVGISATTLTIDTVGKIASLIKKKLPKTIVIVGGAHVTAVPEKTLRKYRSIDIGVIGEGEETLKELLIALDKGKDIRKVDGLIIRDKTKLVCTRPREFIKDLDSLPLPAWDLFAGFPKIYRPALNTFLRLPAAHLFTSRGCTGQCIFCDRSVFGQYPRMHSAKRVLEMVDFLVKNYGVYEIQFYDDNMALFPKRLEGICKGLIRRRHKKISWSCQARCDMLTKEKLLMMKKAGCWQIGLGVESGSDRILKILKKGETKARIKEAIEECAKAGIETKGYFILGNPGETKESLKETVDFILSLPLNYVHTTYFTPYPGSFVYNFASKFGQFKFNNNWAKIGHGTIDAIFIPNGLTKVSLEKTASEIFKKFYFQPKTLLNHLKKMILFPNLWPAYARGFISVSLFAKK